MIILILLILLIIWIFFLMKLEEEIAGFFGGLWVTISILTLLIFLFGYPFKIDAKLNMYEEENTKIETKVKDTVQAYMNYEKETYISLIQEASLETLLIKYPELNSNELVKSEIETYKENSKKIKELKERRINKEIWDWWLYFNVGGKTNET